MGTWKVGDLVRFRHQAETGPSHRVTAVHQLVEIADMSGQFASSVFVAAEPVSVVDVSADGTSAILAGLPLSDLGLDGAIVIDSATGEELGPFQGFVAEPGKSMLDCIKAALGPGRDLIVPAKPKK